MTNTGKSRRSYAAAVGLGVMLGPILLSACAGKTDYAQIEKAVDEFHRLQSSEKDDAIYNAASDELRNQAQLSDIARLNAAVRALTDCSPSKRNPGMWANNYTTSGHFVTVVYERQCAGGPLVETFTFKVTKDRAALAGYNASGMALFPASPAEPSTPDEDAPPIAPSQQT